MIENLILVFLNHSINKKSINVDYSPLTETIDTNSKALKHQNKDRIRITKYTKYKDIFSKY